MKHHFSSPPGHRIIINHSSVWDPPSSPGQHCIKSKQNNCFFHNLYGWKLLKSHLKFACNFVPSTSTQAWAMMSNSCDNKSDEK